MPDGPTTELGQPHTFGTSMPGTPGWQTFAEATDHVPELAWPSSIAVFEKMLTDAQVESLYRGTTLPIRQRIWTLDPNGARDEVVAALSEDLGLPIKGEEDENVPRRSFGSFDFADHLAEALFSLAYGHYYFEQVGQVEDGLWRLRKLGARAPRTIADGGSFRVERDGGLNAIVQGVGGSFGQGVRIPVARLVGYVWDGEARTRWIGRALDPTTPVPTPDGWRTMDDLQPGDRVFDENGQIRHVTARQDWQDRPCYEVTFSSGEAIVADANHQWLSHTYRSRHTTKGGAPELVTTEEMADSVFKYGRTGNHAMPMAGPLEYVEQCQLIDPYVLGYWLGDGDSDHAAITTMDAEVVERIRSRGYEIRKLVPPPSAKASRANHYRVYGLQTKLRVLGLLHNKHVPGEYLHGSYHQRLELLRGLMDSDGNVGGKKEQRGEFCNTRKNLAEAVLELARSLGGRGSIQRYERPRAVIMGQECNQKPVYRVHFNIEDNPFGLSRKADRYDARRTAPKRFHYVTGVARVANRDTVCIEVDSPSHLFVVGRTLVATHNSMLRSLYRHWLVKDRLIRVDAINHERAGGVPYGKGAPGMSQKQLDELGALASKFKVGEHGGAAVPHGADLALLGASGSGVVESIRMHDEAMARAWMLMLFQLGQTESGSRALGSTFADYAALAVNAICDWFAQTFTQHVIDDWVEWNYGPSERYAPRLHHREREAEEGAPPTTEELVRLVDAGVLTVNEETEQWLRSRRGIPLLQQGSRPEPAVPPRVAAASRSRRESGSRLAAAEGVSLPERELRRQPTEIEAKSAVDFARMEAIFAEAIDEAAQLYEQRVIPAQIAEVRKAVTFTKTGKERSRVTQADMARIVVPGMGYDELQAILAEAADAGAAEAARELKEQGVIVSPAERAAIAGRISDQAKAVTDLAAGGMQTAAQRKAVQLAGGTSDAVDVADGVVDHLSGMKHAWTLDQIQGAVTMAQNVGRTTTFERIPKAAKPRYFASELLDDAVCDNCSAADGREYETLDDAIFEYPSGGRSDCKGGPRCRGTIVVVAGTEQPTVT